MKSLRCAIGVLAAPALAGILAGCGGATSQLAPTQAAPAVQPLLYPATNPQRVLARLRGGPAAHVATGRSWMSRAAKNGGLLYVANSMEQSVNVYSFVRWKPFGELLGFGEPITMCVDGAQDVYVTDLAGARVVEYAHGAITPTRVLADHHGLPVACAIDLKTGDLAVSNSNPVTPSSPPGNVIVYHDAKGTPIKYMALGFQNYFFVGYDNNDNLFLDGENASSKMLLAELPAGKSAFKAITPNQPINFPGGVAWDGEYLAVGDQSSNTIYQFKVAHSRARVQGSTMLDGAGDVLQLWFTGSSSTHPQATAVIGADYDGDAVDKWDYPAGGSPLKTISGLDKPAGVVVSR